MGIEVTQQQKIQIDAVARHDLDETFADSLTNISFDGQCWRFELIVVGYVSSTTARCP